MGFRSYYFVRRHVIAQNYGSALMSQHRYSITKVVFSSAVSASFNINRFVDCSGLF
jgi:hypothetical protein